MTCVSPSSASSGAVLAMKPANIGSARGGTLRSRRPAHRRPGSSSPPPAPPRLPPLGRAGARACVPRAPRAPPPKPSGHDANLQKKLDATSRTDPLWPRYRPGSIFPAPSTPAEGPPGTGGLPPPPQQVGVHDPPVRRPRRRPRRDDPLARPRRAARRSASRPASRGRRPSRSPSLGRRARGRRSRRRASPRSTSPSGAALAQPPAGGDLHRAADRVQRHPVAAPPAPAGW